MRITVSKRRTWVPDFAENMYANPHAPENERVPLADEEKLKITYDVPLAYKRSEWIRTYASMSRKGLAETHTEVDSRKVILESNVTIENLRVTEEGKDRDIRTGAELLELRSSFASSLVTLIVNEITRMGLKDELPS